MKFRTSLSNHWSFKICCGRKQVSCSGHAGFIWNCISWSVRRCRFSER